ncbi:hypothetical protein Q8A73_009096 [Channa argus]|nr:hypothetical protein Q8A73_009096 [Channa argus]
MGKEKTKTVKLEKHEPDTYPMIVGEVKKSIPRIRAVKPKEEIRVSTMTSGSTTGRCITTCETSGNVKKLYVNLMPILASAKGPVEEEEVEKEDVNSCRNEKEPESSSKKDQSVIKLAEQTINTSDSYTTLKKKTELKQLFPGIVLPPLTQPKQTPERCGHHKRVCFTPLPPISLFEQTTTTGCRGYGDSRPWIDDLLFSNTRSAEFRLPDITLSSLDTLLQTVTQKMGKKMRDADEGPWRRVQLDHLLLAVNERPLREKMVNHNTEERNKENTYVW